MTRTEVTENATLENRTENPLGWFKYDIILDGQKIGYWECGEAYFINPVLYSATITVEPDCKRLRIFRREESEVSENA